MSFQLLDDSFHAHKKVRKLAEEHPRAFGNALALWTLALSRAGEAHSPVVTMAIAARLVPFERRRLIVAIEALVAVELWDRHENGKDYVIHDWQERSGNARRKRGKKPAIQAISDTNRVQNGSQNGCDDDREDGEEEELEAEEQPATPEPEPAHTETDTETATVLNTEEGVSSGIHEIQATPKVDFMAQLEALADRCEEAHPPVIMTCKMNTKDPKNDTPTRARAELPINTRENTDSVLSETPPAPARAYEKPPDPAPRLAEVDVPVPPKRQDPEAVMIRRRSDGVMISAPNALLAIFSDLRSRAGLGMVTSTYSSQASAQEATRSLLELAEYDPNRFVALTKTAVAGFLADSWRLASDETDETKRQHLARMRTGIRGFAEHAHVYAQPHRDDQAPGGISALRRRAKALAAEIAALVPGDPRADQLRREERQLFDKLRGMHQAAS